MELEVALYRSIIHEYEWHLKNNAAKNRFSYCFHTYNIYTCFLAGEIFIGFSFIEYH